MATDRIVGIDLGTTNSLVAFMQGETPVVIPGDDGLNLLPSVVALDSNNHPVVGNAARKCTDRQAGARRLLDQAPDGPRLGRHSGRIEALPLPPRRGSCKPAKFSASRWATRRSLRRKFPRLFCASSSATPNATSAKPVTKAVITVPAYFNDAQRQATKDAGRIAGLEVLRLVNEPTAASLAYGLDKKQNGIVAVYDLGGGTFDVSILKLHDGIFEVIATNGDTHLGGDDIDNLLITIALDDIRGDLGLDLRRNAEAVQAIRKAVIDAKIALSSEASINLDIELPGGQHYQREITREQYEQLIQPVIDRTVGPCKQAMKDAGLKPEQIDEVVLVGGSTRIPKVRALVKELFHREPHTDLNPDEVVALGAAVQANILGGGSEATENMLLLDVTPCRSASKSPAASPTRSSCATRPSRRRPRSITPRRSMARPTSRSTCCKASANSPPTAVRWPASISKAFRPWPRASRASK